MSEYKLIPDNQKPRERLQKYGPSALTDSQLLQLLLSSGSGDLSVDRISDGIISEIDGNLYELSNYTVNQFMRKGVSVAKASLLVAAVELGRRIATGQPEGRINISHPSDFASVFAADIRSLPQENFLVALINNRMEVIKKLTVSIGNSSSSLSSPRDVFALAIKNGANAIIVAHNHPSGDVSPSGADLSVTKNLVAAGKLMEIPVLDHIIVGTKGYFSFKENGMI